MWNLQADDSVRRFLELECTHCGTLADAFVSSRRIRYGPEPSREHLEESLQCAVSETRPVHVLTMWGGEKGYGIAPKQDADWLDVMALKRFACLNRDVRKFHEPGIRVTIVMENYTGRVLSGYDSPAYRLSLQRLINATGLDFVSIVTESSLIDQSTFGRLVHKNAKAIFKGNETSVGWNGPIAWEHYMGRVLSENPDYDETAQRMKVSLYLGITLARYQAGIMPVSDVKLSFVPYPACVPNSMRRSRIEYKVKPNKCSHKTAAPWTCFGTVGEDDWGHVSLRDIRTGTFDTGYVTINALQIPYLKVA